ncbi:hypothetical protein 8F11_53 [uncultured Caudovirales phage]|uniref:Homeodomain phBC6A51-type domain-containing protein n=1 Tax=uncultured Caudovirales phage TaxID=2100421 RepID=A0A2H4J6Z8_9CAUD|nr:hypothetical protein 8F11_53 [uncultured Caudovirales phage]
MANPRRMKALEAKLTAQQRKAAYLVVENELLPTKERRTKEEIATEVGVTYKTIWSWTTRNRDFIEYKNAIADDFLETEREAVYSNLMQLIKAPQPSVKAIDLYLRRFGLLTEKQIVTTDTGEGARTDADLEQELGELDELLKDDD